MSVVPVVSLVELAARANAEFHATESDLRSAESDLQNALTHAIECGEALSEARARVQPGQWTKWADATLDFSHQQADKYMRLAHYKNVLPSDVRGGLKGCLSLLRGLPPIRDARGSNHYRAHPPQLKVHAVQLRSAGMPYREIAALLGVPIPTLADWCNPGQSERREESKRERRKELKEARAALERERDREERRRVARAKPIAALYADAERMQDTFGAAERQAPNPEARAALAEAGEHYRKMRDDIVRALGFW